MLVRDFYSAIDGFAPFSGCEGWDNSGLLVGSLNTRVKAAVVALDVTPGVIAQAELLGANLIIAHHPAIFSPLRRIEGNSLLHRVIAANLQIIAAHTNLDSAPGGVNDALASALGLLNVRAAEGASPARIGSLPAAIMPAELAALVRDKLSAGKVSFTGAGKITEIAVCGGAGGELWQAAREIGAQALVTGEAKHHCLVEAASCGFAIIEAGHFATERVIVEPLCARLRQLLPGVEIHAAREDDPAAYL